MQLIQRIVTPKWRPGRAALAGTLATVAYSVAMEADMAILGNRFNDVRFIQGLLERAPQPQKRFPWLAWGIHFLNGVILAEIYAALGKRFLPGPNWLKGTIFSELFVLASWTATPLVDKYHPMVQSGYLPKLTNRRSFLQNLLRHLPFGLLLGLIYGD